MRRASAARWPGHPTRVRRVMKLALGVAVLAIWVLTLRPALLGGPATYIVVRGGSMLPEYHSGDLVVLHVADGYAVGDIVGYVVPAGEVGAGHVVLHRIVGGDGQTGFTMEGDNNPAPDPWLPRTSDVAGRLWLLVPGLGSVITLIHQPATAAALAVSGLMMLVLARRRPSRTVQLARADTGLQGRPV
jgi:signal peptidase I